MFVFFVISQSQSCLTNKRAQNFGAVFFWDQERENSQYGSCKPRGVLEMLRCNQRLGSRIRARLLAAGQPLETFASGWQIGRLCTPAVSTESPTTSTAERSNVASASAWFPGWADQSPGDSAQRENDCAWEKRVTIVPIRHGPGVASLAMELPLAGARKNCE